MASSLECSYNPFEPWCNNNRIHFPDFSPSLLKKMPTPDRRKNKSFRWSIEELAVMDPADIDEYPDQDSMTWLSKEQEEESQSAIETYFSQNLIAPSPWVNDKSENFRKKNHSMPKSPFMPINSTALLVTPESCQRSSSQKVYKDILLSSLRKKLFLQGTAATCQYRHSYVKSPLAAHSRISVNSSYCGDSGDDKTFNRMSLSETGLLSQESSYASNCSQLSSTPTRSSMIRSEMVSFDISPVSCHGCSNPQTEWTPDTSDNAMDISVRKLSFDDLSD